MNKITTTFLSALLSIALTAPVMAQPEVRGIAIDSAAIPAADTTAKSGVYIVMMRDNPAVAYAGDISAYKATKPGKGQKINPNSASVKKYVSYLQSTHDKALGAVGAGDKLYSYNYALNGFAAVLSSTQVEALRARDDVVQVWQDEIRQPTTDSTPDYLGLTSQGGVWDLEGKGEDMIVGIIDTGIWPEHESFSDQIDFSDSNGSSGKRNLAYGPPPAGWTGSCQSGEQWSQDNCNNKVIGARYYNAGFGVGSSAILPSEFLSARDSDGHGSHTASTAAGNEGPINTLTSKPVSGIAPRARIAVYKVCWDDVIDPDGGGCASSDSAAAIDQAVADGVDVINFSIGGASTVFAGADDIAFLFAADAGVWVATSNGNDGPLPQTTGTPAGVPWLTAVGAAQDNEVFAISLEVSGDLSDSYFALEGGGPVKFAGITSGDMVVADPLEGCSTFNNAIAGEIALVRRGTCSFSTKYNNAAAAGASAIIVYNDGTNAGRIDPIVMSAPGVTIPGAMIGFNDGDAINAAVSGGGSVSGSIDENNLDLRDNRIAGFSSRGPNGGAPDVIKPDVAAPGVSIIAAETLQPNANAAGGVPYQSISGTSMASPHVAGTFALLKEAHPDWSPAMAKSAVMTSARQDLMKTARDEAADPFDIGAGAIVPAGAFAPGLVYDAGLFEYAAFTCGNNVQIFSNGTCDFLASLGLSFDGSELNLASIGIGSFVGSQTVTRTVTSVSPDGTTFTANVEAPSGVDVAVSPSAFTLNEGGAQTFTVEFSANAGVVLDTWTFGSLTWDNDSGQTPARSPIAIRPVQISADAEVDASGTDGSADIGVEFGYTGDYSAVLNGLAEAAAISDNVSAAEGLDALCIDLPALDHIRFATFDEDTTTPGADDIDLRLIAVDSCAAFNILGQIGGSGGATSAELIDVANPGAGGYAFVIDYFRAASGTDIDYTAFIYFVSGDDGNATLSNVPASATLGGSATETVTYFGLNPGSRYLGVVSHQDSGNEIARSIVDVNAQ